jgi:hypothetical protein
VEEVTDEPLYRDRVCGIDIGKAGMAATIRVPSDKDPSRRASETRSFGSTKREVLVLADWLRCWQVPTVVMEATGDYWGTTLILRGGMGAKSRAAALARLQPQPGGPPLLVVATGPYAGEGFDCPALDTLFLAAPVANKGSLTQYVGRILRSRENKATAEVHDYLDERTGVLAAMLAKRAPGYTGLGFPDPRKLALTPSASTDSSPVLQAI